MMNKRNEYFIREDIIKCYNDLDSLDINKYTKTQLRSKYSKINKELKNLLRIWQSCPSGRSSKLVSKKYLFDRKKVKND